MTASYSANSAIVTFTWAAKPASYPIGQPVFISNVGPKGTFWYYDGARWKPVNNIALLASLDATSSNITNSADTIVFSYAMPAALLQLNDRLRLRVSASKSGTTDVGNLIVRLGAAGTTSDVTLFGGAFIGAANVAGALALDFRVASASTILTLGNSGVTTPTGGYSQQSTAAVAAAVTLAASATIASALTFSISLQSAGATNTINLRDAQLELCAPAN